MWHRLVANKLHCRPPGSSCFVADFPSSDELPEIPDTDLVPSVGSRTLSTDQKSTISYKLFASTWNVGGVAPSDDLSFEDWLETDNTTYDIYVLGFQEVIPLSAKNVLGPERSRISAKWNSLIQTTLNKTLAHQQGNGFQCIVSKQMVGILLSVFVRGDLERYVHLRGFSSVGCGIMGCLGNKGAVSVRFWMHETSLCFVCCHLASGGKEGDEQQRNSDAMEIFSRTCFPRGPHLRLPQKILDHDRVILLGDLNYRITLSDATTRLLVKQKQWSRLLENDQLRVEVSEGRAFGGWREGAISFSPTYKYYPKSDEYYGRANGRKEEKWRSPAWCDRILWYGKGLKQNRYERCELRLSDHRPVRAIFTVDVHA